MDNEDGDGDGGDEEKMSGADELSDVDDFDMEL